MRQSNAPLLLGIVLSALTLRLLVWYPQWQDDRDYIDRMNSKIEQQERHMEVTRKVQQVIADLQRLNEP